MTEWRFISRVAPHHGIGGMQQVAWDLARQFVAEGDRVTFLTTRIDNKAAAFEEDGVRVIALQDTAPGVIDSAWWRSSRTWLAQAPDVDAEVSVGIGAWAAWRTVPPDETLRIFQIHGTRWDEVASRHARRRSPRILSLRPRDVRFMRKERWLLRNATTVCVGRPLQRRLAQAPYNASNVHWIGNGIDTGLFHPDAAAGRRWRRAHQIPAKDMLVLTTGRMAPDKGLLDALAGFARLHENDPRSHYALVGDGPARPDLETAVASLGLEDAVTFTGRVPRGDLPGAYQATDVFLFVPYRLEGHPLNMMEAVASRTPCVLAPHLVSADMGTASDGVVAADPKDPAAVAVALGAAINNDARPSLQDSFTLPGCAAAYRTLLVGP